MTERNYFTPEDIEAFAPAEKVGIVATVNENKLPHISLLTSLMAQNEKTLTIGEFCRGMSKEYMQKNHAIAFLLLTMDKLLWRGRARWRHLKHEGPEYEVYNRQPMFRYNTYFGINTVHYLDLESIEGPQNLPMTGIVTAALKTRLAKGGAKEKSPAKKMKTFALDLFNRLDSMKFLSYVGSDGFPHLIPVIQCQASDTSRLIFNPGPFAEEIAAIPAGTSVALYGLTMAMESVLVRGTFQPARRYRGISAATVDVSWVYNSMPPGHGQIYPEKPLEAVTRF